MQKSKKDKKKYTGFPGDCSEEQLTVLDKFRTIVKTIDNGELDQQLDEAYLLRFLRARKFSLKETEKMWIEFINWRKKMQMDKLKTYYFPQLVALRKIYPHGYHKVDKKVKIIDIQYRPIYIERVGFTQPSDIFKLTNEDSLLKYYALSYQTLLTKIFDVCTQQKFRQTGDGTRVNQTCTILDLKDIKLSKVNDAYKFAKPASEMAQNNYPEMLGNMFIINAPFLFTGVWAIVKMWIDDKTRQKIQILGKDYKKELLKHIDPENLPDFLDGGTCKCKGGDCLSINIGPWNPEGEELFPQCLHKGYQVQAQIKPAKKQIQPSDVIKKEKQQKQLVEKVQNLQLNGQKKEDISPKTQIKSIQS